MVGEWMDQNRLAVAWRNTHKGGDAPSANGRRLDHDSQSSVTGLSLHGLLSSLTTYSSVLPVDKSPDRRNRTWSARRKTKSRNVLARAANNTPSSNLHSCMGAPHKENANGNSLPCPTMPLRLAGVSQVNLSSTNGQAGCRGTRTKETNVLVLGRRARDAARSFRLSMMSESLPKKSQRSLQSPNDLASASLSERGKCLLAAWR